MNMVISRQLGAEEAGLFSLAYTIVFIAAAIGRLGVDNTSFVRFIAAHHSTNDWGRELFARCYTRYLVDDLLRWPEPIFVQWETRPRDLALLTLALL